MKAEMKNEGVNLVGLTGVLIMEYSLQYRFIF